MHYYVPFSNKSLYAYVAIVYGEHTHTHTHKFHVHSDKNACMCMVQKMGHDNHTLINTTVLYLLITALDTTHMDGENEKEC